MKIHNVITYVSKKKKVQKKVAKSFYQFDKGVHEINSRVPQNMLDLPDT